MDTEMEHEAFSNLTNVQSFFYGQSVFLTGVTGLVGKVILEKILRCCPGIGMIYIHMRPKKGLTPQQRAEKLFNLELFREVKAVFPLFRKRVQVVEGDITEHRLGLSLDDFENIRRNVSIVIHSAASVTFFEPIKVAVENNVFPVQRILDLCHEMPNIKAVILLSTAYVNKEEDGRVLEEVAKCKVDPEKLIQALEWMDSKGQAAVQEYLLNNKLGQQNTYLITKAMAEVIAQRRRGGLPLAMVRPCYICNTWKDPFPGWIDTIQGVSGIFLAGAKGVVRTLYTVPGLRVNLIPVDVLANTVVTSAWHVGTTKPVDIFVVNCTMDYNTLPPAEETLLHIVMEKREKYPLVNMFRYPDFTYYYSKFPYQVHALFDQWIPALIVDLLLFTFTGKTVLMRIYSKINFLYAVFYNLSKEPWIHQLNNYRLLQKKLSEEDEKIFFMSLDNFDWGEYLDICLKGGRIFLAHEDPSNINYAKKKAKIWWAVTTILKWSLILYIFYYLLNCSTFSPFYKGIQEKLHIVHS